VGRAIVGCLVLAVPKEMRFPFSSELSIAFIV
jgi:hypothetical protein